MFMNFASHKQCPSDFHVLDVISQRVNSPAPPVILREPLSFLLKCDVINGRLLIKMGVIGFRLLLSVLRLYYELRF